MDNWLTVIVTVYNKKAYLQECLDSILNQTYKNIKLVIVDDGSTDGSEVICDSYGESENISVIHQENKGVIVARARGIQETHTEYVTFVDADDFIADIMYERMMEKIAQYNVDMVACGCFRYWDKDDFSQDSCSGFSEGLYEKKTIMNTIVTSMLWSKEKNGWELDPSLCMKIVRTKYLWEQYNQIKGNDFHYGEDPAIIYPMIFDLESMYIMKDPYYFHRQRLRTENAAYLTADDYFEKVFSLYVYLKKQFKRLKVFSIMEQQLDVYYMRSVQLCKKYGQADTQEYKWLFPFGKVEKNSNVVLYGAGKVGKAYYEQVQETRYCNIVLWIDKNVREEKIKAIDEITRTEYDCVVIARKDETAKRKMEEILVSLGVQNSKII